MNKKMIMLMAAALALLSARGQEVEFTGDILNDYPVYEITLSDAHNRMNKIYVLYDTVGVGMSFKSSVGNRAVWKIFDSRGAGYAPDQPLPTSWDGHQTTTLSQVSSDRGYIIDDGTQPFYCWVVNYSKHYLKLNGLSYIEGSPLDPLIFEVDGQGDKIRYPEIDGPLQVLDREIKLIYDTQEWNDSIEDEEPSWETKSIVKTFKSLEEDISIDQPPYCNTSFIIQGDRFLDYWHKTDSAMIVRYETKTVGCESTANQIKRDNVNEKGLNSGLGGSAPVVIVFTGYPTAEVVYREWMMATDADFENIIRRDNQDEVEYTFMDAGTYYVRYMVDNAEGTCPTYGEVYTVTVDVSKLDCPNIFTPNGDEVNDVWRVTYESIVEFHCWIFNRWGNLIYEYTDPGGGWDGTYHGKPVDTGVYFYVIRAVGSDGKKWTPSGDINILHYKSGGGVPGGDGTGNTDIGY